MRGPEGHGGPIEAWIAQLKKGLAAIAAAKSSQQFGERRGEGKMSNMK